MKYILILLLVAGLSFGQERVVLNKVQNQILIGDVVTPIDSLSSHYLSEEEKEIGYQILAIIIKADVVVFEVVKDGEAGVLIEKPIDLLTTAYLEQRNKPLVEVKNEVIN